MKAGNVWRMLIALAAICGVICGWMSIAGADTLPRYEWKSIGPFTGGSAYSVALAIDPVNPSTVYAGLTDAGIYKSTDNGANWVSVNTPETRGLSVYNITVDPSNSSTVYAGTNNGLFRTTDGGATWSSVPTGSTNQYALSLAVAGTKIYVGTGAGAFQSSDSGATWNPVAPIGNSMVSSIIVAGSNVFAATTAGIYVTSDGGSTWAPQNSGLTMTDVRAIAADPATPSTLYAGTWRDGVFKSTDGGGSWTPSTSGISLGYIRHLAVAPLDPQTVLASTDAGVFRSTNGGTNWGLVVNGPRSVQAYMTAIAPINPPMVFAATSEGLYESPDGGDNWIQRNNGIVTLQVHSLVIDPNAAGTVIMAATGNVSRSTDRGNFWTKIITGLGSTNVRAMAADPVSPGILYAGTDIGMYRSLNNGEQWVGIGNGLGEASITGIATVPGTMLNLYVATDSGVYKTTDGGEQWTAANGDQTAPLTQLNVKAVAVSVAFPGTIYAGTDNGIFKSADGGAHWSLLANSPQFVRTIAIDPSSEVGVNDKVYAGTFTNAYRSADSGATWQWVSNGLTNSFVNAFVFDGTSTASTVYAGTEGGVFFTTDNGANWHELNNGLTNLKVRALAIEPTRRTLFAGTAGNGVFRLPSVDLTVSPAPHNFGNISLHTSSSVQPLVISNTSGGTMFISSIALIEGSSTMFPVTLGTCPDFTMALGPGQSCTINVRFVPEQLGTSTAMLRISSNSINYPAIDVTLTGTGVLQAFGLTLNTTGTGTGAINVSTGDSCTGNCALAFSSGTSVTLTAAPDSSTTFAGWTGCVADQQFPDRCTVVMDGPKTVKAAFNAVPQLSPLYPWAATSGAFKANRLTAAPSAPSTIYAGSDSGVYVSNDKGSSWTQAAGAGLTDAAVRALAVNPIEATEVFAGTASGIFKTTDSGATWAAVNEGLTTVTTRDIVIDPASSTIYAATAGGIYKSSNGGSSWSDGGLNGSDVLALATIPGTPSTLYAGTAGPSGGLYRSTDGGLNWEQVTTGLSQIGAIAATPTRLYAGGIFNTGLNGGVIGSADGGATWTKTTGELATTVTSVAVDATTGNVYAGTTTLGVYASFDDGSTWSSLTTGIETKAINAVTVAPTSAAPTVLAGANDGVFRLTTAAIALSPDTAVFTYTESSGAISTKVRTFSVSDERTFTVTNGGTARLLISSITVTGTDSADFQVLAGGCSPTADLAPGASCTITTVFAPTTVGLKSATLEIASNDPSAAIKLGTLSGEAYDPPPFGTISINGGAAATNTPSVTLSLFATDNGGGAIEMQFSNDGTYWSAWEAFNSRKSWTLSNGNGVKTVYVRFRDGAGNVSGKFSNRIMLNALPPVATITSMPVPMYTSGSGSFSFIADQPGCTFTCRVDAGSYVNCSSPFAFSGLADGSHTFSVKATSSAGITQTSDTTYSWVVDTVPPNTTMLTTPAATTFAVPTAFTFSGEAGGTFECRMDSLPYGACSSPYMAAPQTAGSHTLSVRAVDAAGNPDPTPATYTWTTLAPDTVIDSTPPNPSSAASGTFSFHSSVAGATFECKVDNGNFAQCSSPYTVNSLGAGSHTFTVRARDAAGNVDSNPPAYTWTVASATGPVKMIYAGGGSDFFNTVNGALAAVPATTTVDLLLRELTFTEDAVFNQDATANIKGGYDSSFTNQSGVTTIVGSLTIQTGTLIVSELVIQ